MRTLRYRSNNSVVHLLEELLVRIGYKVYVSNYFGKDTDIAVKDFQSKNKLVIDGIVGSKTWAKLIEKEKVVLSHTSKFLSEKDLIAFGNEFDLDLATVKAVNEVESAGKGFFIDGRPKILFEGHVFWRQLEERGYKPKDLQNDDNKDVLYQRWTRSHYLGGTREYERLKKAAAIKDSKKVRDAAYCSASWGAFQIMGYHYKSLGYGSIDKFVALMKKNEKEHLFAFGKFISVNTRSGKSLLYWLQKRNWAKFARGYNGPGYATNKYDIKLKKAYERYS